MAICRWSSMNYGCDLYCYESKRGFITHVASKRVLGEVPNVNWAKGSVEFPEALEEQRRFMESAEYSLIGLKYDGLSFIDSKETFLSRLNMLREEGYKFPEINEDDLE